MYVALVVAALAVAMFLGALRPKRATAPLGDKSAAVQSYVLAIQTGQWPARPVGKD